MDIKLRYKEFIKAIKNTKRYGENSMRNEAKPCNLNGGTSTSSLERQILWIRIDFCITLESREIENS